MILPAEPKKKKIRNWLIAVVVILLYIWAFAGVPFAGVKENVGYRSHLPLRSLRSKLNGQPVQIDTR